MINSQVKVDTNMLMADGIIRLICLRKILGSTPPPPPSQAGFLNQGFAGLFQHI
jgi:hypothetical protein